MVEIRIAAALLLACALHVPGASWAQNAPAPITLARAVDAAWARALASAESSAQTRRADAALQAAQAPWAAAPSLELGQRRDRSAQANGRETDIGITVPLWLPGQRAARLGAAAAEHQAARAAIDTGRLRVAAQVREAQGNYYLQQAELVSAEAQRRTFAELTRDVERRVAAGDLARTDALAASAEQLAAQATVLGARQRVAAALTQWRALTGLVQVAEQAPGASPLAANVPQDHPALVGAGLSVQLAQRRLDAVNAARRDPPEITVGARHDAPAGGGSSSRGIGVSLRVPFATEDRNQPLVAQALAELELAQARETRLRADLAAELEIAYAGLEAGRLGVTDEEIRSRLLRERYDLLDRSYRAGNTALSDLLRALTAAAQADGELQRKKAALELAHARVQQALGILP